MLGFFVLQRHCFARQIFARLQIGVLNQFADGESLLLNGAFAREKTLLVFVGDNGTAQPLGRRALVGGDHLIGGIPIRLG